MKIKEAFLLTLVSFFLVGCKDEYAPIDGWKNYMGNRKDTYLNSDETYYKLRPLTWEEANVPGGPEAVQCFYLDNIFTFSFRNMDEEKFVYIELGASLNHSIGEPVPPDPYSMYFDDETSSLIVNYENYSKTAFEVYLKTKYYKYCFCIIAKRDLNN